MDECNDEEKAKKEEETFRTQRKVTERFIKYDLDDPNAKEQNRILDIAIDDVSGEFVLECPEVQNLFKTIDEDTEYQYRVIAPKTNRYTREVWNAIGLEKELTKRNVRLYFADAQNPKNRRDAQGNLVRQMGYVIAGYQKEDLSETMRTNKHSKLSRNVWALGLDKLPDGFKQRAKKDLYDKEDRPVYHDEERRKMWQWVHKMSHLDDYSLHKVAKELNGAGYTTRNGNPWTEQALSDLLSGPGLCGIVVCNRYDMDMYMTTDKKGDYKKRTKQLSENPVSDWIVVDFTKPPNNAKPMLTQEQLWGICLDLHRRKTKANGSTPKGTHILKNAVKLVCGVCGGTISKHRGYYVCLNHLRYDEEELALNGKEKCHDAKLARADDVDDYVISTTIQMLTMDDKVVDLLMDTASLKKTLSLYRVDIDRLDGKKQEYVKKQKLNYKTFLAEKVSEDNYLDAKAEIEKFIHKIDADIAIKQEAYDEVQHRLDNINNARGGRLQAIARRCLPLQNLKDMSFDEKKKLLKILYKDFTFYLHPITREEVDKRVLPPDENEKDHGYFFNGRNKKVGTLVYCEGFWDEEEIIKRFQSTFIQNVDTVGGHNHVTVDTEGAFSYTHPGEQ